MSSTVPERPPNTEPLPSAEELAEARTALEPHARPVDMTAYYLAAYLSGTIRDHARRGYDPDANRRALAMVAAYEQLRMEQANRIAAAQAAGGAPAADQAGDLGGETVEDAEDQS